MTALAHTDVEPAYVPAWPLALPPMGRQHDALLHTIRHPASMLAIAMGGGKSATAIAHAESTQAMRVLVVGPKSVVPVWPDQVEQHGVRNWHVWAGDVYGARGRLKNPSVPRRVEALIQANTSAIRLRRPFMAVVNFEAVNQPAMAALLLGTDWDLVVIDESHRIKAPTGKASRLIARVTSRCRSRGGRVIAMTGTPMPHSPLDLFGQFRAIQPHCLGENWTAFRARYGAPKVLRRTPDGQPDIYMRTPRGDVIYDGVRDEMLPELTDRVSNLMFQVTQEELDEALGLPDGVDVFRTCQLEPETRRVYDELERDLISHVGNGTVTASNAMVNVIRLAQATSGFAVDADTGVAHRLADPPEKSRLFADVLEDLDRREPIVVFARFHHDLDEIQRVCAEQGRTYGELSGRRRDAMNGPRMSDQIDVAGVQLKSGGVGIDLTRARYAIYFTLDFNLGEYLQSRRRVLRPGQTRHVTYIHLLADDTVDRAIFGALRSREDVVTAVLARLNQRSST